MKRAIAFLKSFYRNDINTTYCQVIELEENNEVEMTRQLLIATQNALKACSIEFEEGYQVIEDILQSF